MCVTLEGHCLADDCLRWCGVVGWWLSVVLHRLCLVEMFSEADEDVVFHAEVGFHTAHKHTETNKQTW